MPCENCKRRNTNKPPFCAVCKYSLKRVTVRKEKECPICLKTKELRSFEKDFDTCKVCNRKRTNNDSYHDEDLKMKLNNKELKDEQRKKDLEYFNARVGVVHKGKRPYFQ